MAVVGKAVLVASFAEVALVASCLVTTLPNLRTALAAVGTSVTAVVGTLVVAVEASFAVDTLVTAGASFVEDVTLVGP